MNPTIQSGTHPDAESLTAFAEQLLRGAEREVILAHMAVCGRCREVVFLAQQATEAERPAQVSVEIPATEKTGRRWFGGWRWAWIPVAALAGFVGFAVVQHVRHSPERQMAHNVRQTEALQGAMAAKANAPAMQQAPKRDESTMLSAVRPGAATAKAKAVSEQEIAKALDAKKAAEKDESKQSLDAVNASVGVAGGAIHGTFEARAKSSSIGGPMAQNQMQQQNFTLQQNVLGAQAPASEMSNKPLAPVAPSPVAHPGAVAESVEVQPVQQAAPSPARQMTMVPVTGQNLEVAREKVAKEKGPKVMLPSGLEALSVATEAQHTIAIDTAGALFLSEDAGKHWQPVKTQWTGRAVLVRTPQAGADSAMLLKQQGPHFELVNDKLQTWVSLDGKTWTQQRLLGK